MIRHPEVRAKRASKDDGPGARRFEGWRQGPGRILRGPLRGHLRMTGMVLAVLMTALSSTRAQTIDEKAQACSACHGENGVPQEKNVPVIWGQQLGYLYLQLRDFKSGARKNELMSPIAEALVQEDLLPLAQHFSQKKWPNLQQPPAPDAVAAIATRANDSIGCVGCHQAGYKGEGTQPRLAGQHKDYLLKSMLDFRAGTRANNPGMTDLMKATPQDAFAPLAEYMAGLSGP
jgi:cytochrome c553